MTCSPLVSSKNICVGHLCYTPSYFCYCQGKKLEFLYSPWYGVDILDAKGRARKKPATKKEWKAICDWLHRNTYKRCPHGDRELIGYVKKRWKP